MEALKIAYDQGLTGPADARRGINEPWKRAFTYGHAREAQWLAKIYLDVDLLTTDHGPQFGFRRVLVGAPLWIRTPDPRAIRLYATSDDIEVAASRRIRVNRHTTKSIASSQAGNRDEASHGAAVHRATRSISLSVRLSTHQDQLSQSLFVFIACYWGVSREYG